MSIAQGPAGTFYLTAGISLLFASFGFVLGLFIPYFPVYLEDLMYSPVQIAFIVSLPNLLKVVSTPVLTMLSDRGGRRRFSIALYALFCLLAYVLLAYITGYYLVVLVVAVISIFMAPITPLSDAYAFEAVNNRGLDYGRMRSVGSLAFIVANMFGGWYIGFLPARHLLFFIALAFVVVIVSALSLPSMPSETRGEAKANERSTSNELRQKQLHMVLLGAGLALGSMGALFSFGSLFWLANGLRDTDVGLLWSVGVIAEITVFLLGGRLVKRFGIMPILFIGVSGAIVRWVLFPYANDFLSAFAVQLLHGLNFGMVYLALMTYQSRVVSAARLGTAQGFFQTYTGLFTGLTGIASGWLYEIEPAYAFFAMSVVATVGLLVILLARVDQTKLEVRLRSS
ncbi:MFS transporter [Polycladidibacter stylochi]|uniref:MFS transporter n=1 Tax=Polycladidibacter stylochi TaxID=1807766 RepID=UPI00082C08BC|nr:MFS transporter [Pseudovibrio stylochi]